MLFKIDLNDDHVANLLKLCNMVNESSIGTPLTTINTVVDVGTVPVNNRYTTLFSKRSNLSDNVAVTHTKLKLTDFIKFTKEDLGWFNPAEYTPLKDNERLKIMFNRKLDEIGINPTLAWDGDYAIEVIDDRVNGYYVLSIGMVSAIWEDRQQFILAVPFESVFTGDVLDGFYLETSE